MNNCPLRSPSRKRLVSILQKHEKFELAISGGAIADLMFRFLKSSFNTFNIPSYILKAIIRALAFTSQSVPFSDGRSDFSVIIPWALVLTSKSPCFGSRLNSRIIKLFLSVMINKRSLSSLGIRKDFMTDIRPLRGISFNDRKPSAVTRIKFKSVGDVKFPELNLAIVLIQAKNSKNRLPEMALKTAVDFCAVTTQKDFCENLLRNKNFQINNDDDIKPRDNFFSEQLGLKRTTIVAKSNKLRSFRQFSGTAKMKCLISSLNSESDNCVLQVLNCSNVPFSLFYSCD
ncbi:hypothetical protein DERF_000912 [Dermatophagoides farinae]|uniref:Uncharacterized protein n=1 Tax=Dermatophagoides farinae TaxID=6954 RepID=A0A922L8U5_DERFA|nr:hypothetical protein DERF_000912 [Dermatophagoides farinae]